MNFVNANEQEIKHIVRELTVKIARHLDITDPEVEDSFVLTEKIKNSDEQLYTMLNDFSTAYMSFYYMVKTITASKKGSALSPTDVAKLQLLFDKKEKIKVAILTAIRKGEGFYSEPSVAGSPSFME